MPACCPSSWLQTATCAPVVQQPFIWPTIGMQELKLRPWVLVSAAPCGAGSDERQCSGGLHPAVQQEAMAAGVRCIGACNFGGAPG